MKVSGILTYPVKGIRAIELDSVTLTRYGFPHERRFMLMKVRPDPNDASRSLLAKMQVDSFPELVLFRPTMKTPSSPTSSDGELTITFNDPDPSPVNHRGPDPPGSEPLRFPLQPDISTLEPVDIDLHGSPTPAYRMPEACNSWFSARLGYEAVLVYLGPHLREVLYADRSEPELSRGPDSLPTPPPEDDEGGVGGGDGNVGWMAGLASAMPRILPRGMSGNGGGGEGEGEGLRPAQLTFTDVAPYLVVSERSMDDVHHRLWGGEGEGERSGGEKDGERMDITKFRPNIIVSGAGEAWEEDFWRRLEVTSSKGRVDGERNGGDEGVTATATALVCLHNCGRCNSINVDYATGKVGTGEAGKILKKLQKDRRVDKGAKYSPIFGRYAFLAPGCEGNEIRVGDEVEVTERNAERTTFGKCYDTGWILIHESRGANEGVVDIDWKSLAT